nr:reverse transcriptase domain-containing protein [Tanacetum cinerariifolium]
MEKMKSLTTKIDSQFKEIKGEMKEMRDGFNSYGGPHLLSKCDDKPMGGPEYKEAEHSVNLDEFGDVLVRISPCTSIKLAVFDHQKVMTFNGEVVFKVNHDDSWPMSGCYGSVVSLHRLIVAYKEWL